MSRTRIFVAGHKGMVGSAIIRHLRKQDKIEIITRDKNVLDLVDQSQVNKFFKKKKIDQLYMAAAKVGGIYANSTYPAEFIYENIMVQSNLINAAFQNGVKKLLFLGSSCIYPKHANQPMVEEELLTGPLEPTNRPYAIAKISGIIMIDSYAHQYGKSHNLDYRCVMPTNLYGVGDKFDLQNSHVIPALIKKFHEAKIKNLPEVTIWGTGNQLREFLYVDDFAKASYFIMNIDRDKYDRVRSNCTHINVGSGTDLTIKELAENIKEIIRYQGKIKFDSSKPDGTDRKLIDSSRINSLGWKSEVSLKEGLKKVYNYYQSLL